MGKEWERNGLVESKRAYVIINAKLKDAKNKEKEGREEQKIKGKRRIRERRVEASRKGKEKNW